MEKRVPLAKEDEKEAFTMARDKSHHHSKINAKHPNQNNIFFDYLKILLFFVILIFFFN